MSQIVNLYTHKTVEELRETLTTGSDILTSKLNLRLLSSMLAEAVSQDVRAASCDEIASRVVRPPIIEHGDRYQLDSSGWFCCPSAAYLMHVEWLTRLGDYLGFKSDEDVGMNIAWLGNNLNIRKVFDAVMMIYIEVVDAASSAYKSKHGHCMAEVFVASCETGEDFDQTRVRLTAQRRGLRAVK